MFSGCAGCKSVGCRGTAVYAREQCGELDSGQIAIQCVAAGRHRPGWDKLRANELIGFSLSPGSCCGAHVAHVVRGSHAAHAVGHASAESWVHVAHDTGRTRVIMPCVWGPFCTASVAHAAGEGGRGVAHEAQARGGELAAERQRGVACGRPHCSQAAARDALAANEATRLVTYTSKVLDGAAESNGEQRDDLEPMCRLRRGQRSLSRSVKYGRPSGTVHERHHDLEPMHCLKQ
eukprot:359243-Chlamydomonas_euryale.AAC.4